MQLTGKTAIITGASSGIGATAAKLFAAEGAAVVLGARRGNLLRGLCSEIEAKGGRARFMQGDVRDSDFATALVATAEQQFGGLDIAFNNAGVVGDQMPVTELPEAAWHDIIATNLTSAFLAAKAQIPAMTRRGGGSMIFTSSFVGTTWGLPGMGAYAAAKAGLGGLTQTLAVENGKAGIRVNALLPGGTRTAMAGDEATNPDTAAFLRGLHALDRIAEPEEIARTAMFLASDAASFVTGTSMIVDGGNSVFKF